MLKIAGKTISVLLAALLISGVTYLVVEKTSLASALGPGVPGGHGGMGAPGAGFYGGNRSMGSTSGFAFGDGDFDGDEAGFGGFGREGEHGRHGGGFSLMGLTGMLKNTLIFAVVTLGVVAVRRLFAKNNVQRPRFNV